MKYTLAVLALSFSAFSWADSVRDLNKLPLSAAEWSAYRASSSLAKELKVKIKPECVNASFVFNTSDLKKKSDYVIVQFYSAPSKGEKASCGDPHYSIEVEFSEGEIKSLTKVDA